MEQTSITVPQYDSPANMTKIQLCSNCIRDIPFLALMKFNGRMTIKIRIFYSNKEMETTSDGDLVTIKFTERSGLKSCLYHNLIEVKYCLHCSVWLCKQCIIFHQLRLENHVLLDNEVNVACNQFYCQNCNDDISNESQNNDWNPEQSQLINGNGREIREFHQKESFRRYIKITNRDIDQFIQRTFLQLKYEISQPVLRSTLQGNASLNELSGLMCDVIHKTNIYQETHSLLYHYYKIAHFICVLCFVELKKNNKSINIFFESKNIKSKAYPHSNCNMLSQGNCQCLSQLPNHERYPFCLFGLYNGRSPSFRQNLKKKLDMRTGNSKPRLTGSIANFPLTKPNLNTVEASISENAIHPQTNDNSNGMTSVSQNEENDSNTIITNDISINSDMNLKDAEANIVDKPIPLVKSYFNYKKFVFNLKTFSNISIFQLKAIQIIFLANLFFICISVIVQFFTNEHEYEYKYQHEYKYKYQRIGYSHIFYYLTKSIIFYLICNLIILMTLSINSVNIDMEEYAEKKAKQLDNEDHPIVELETIQKVQNTFQYDIIQPLNKKNKQTRSKGKSRRRNKKSFKILDHNIKTKDNNFVINSKEVNQNLQNSEVLQEEKEEQEEQEEPIDDQSSNQLNIISTKVKGWQIFFIIAILIMKFKHYTSIFCSLRRTFHKNWLIDYLVNFCFSIGFLIVMFIFFGII